MKKTIILSERQIKEILGGDTSYLGGTMGKDNKSQPGTEISAGTNTSMGPSVPIDTDKVADSITVNQMGPWSMRGYQRRGLAKEGNERNDKKKILESNSDLEGTFYQIDPTTAIELLKIFLSSKSSLDSPGRMRLGKILNDGKIEYTNMTTIKSEMDNMNHDLPEYTEMGGDVLKSFIDRNLKLATGVIANDKKNKKENGLENAYIQKHTKDSGNGKGHSEQTNIILK